MSNTELESHFAFGENWQSYSKLIDPGKIEAAVTGLSEFVGPLGGRSFLDIGCGSGLSSLAALRLGASPLVATDIDPKSIETTRQVLSRFAGASSWNADTISVLSSEFDRLGEFDVVYSWGVLHHTGNMRKAIEKAAKHVKPGGMFAIAIYRRTTLCNLWRVEKMIYSKSPRFVQDIIFHAYRFLKQIYVTMKTGHRELKLERGMDRDHDDRDWLGGYPYESARPEEIDQIVLPLGFHRTNDVSAPKSLGFFGSGCAEYLYRRR